MEQSILQQSSGILAQAERCYVFLPAKPTADALAAGIALHHALTRRKKQVRVVASEASIPEHLRFLAGSEAIQRTLGDDGQFVISLDLTNAQVGKFSYAMDGSALRIYITPSRGIFTERDVRAQRGVPKPDAIIVLDAPDLEALGGAADAHPELFYSAPILNIDHHPSNTRFGKVNAVELTAASTSEALFQLLHGLGREHLDEPTATALLTGIMSTTRSFQTMSVTPSTLAAASELVALGARREVIVQHLLQTKSLPTLHLWGRALARLQTAHDGRLVWTVLRRADFERSGGSEAGLAQLVEELMGDVPSARVITLLYEANDGTFHGIIRAAPSVTLGDVLHDLRPMHAEHMLQIQTGARTAEDAERMLRERLAPIVQP